MDTIKISINTQSAESWLSDVLMAGMADLGFDTFEETETGFAAYIPERLYSHELLDNLVREVSGEFPVHFSAETIAARNWNEVWEKNYFKPLVIGDQVVVRAPFHTDYPVARHEIIIEPNMAFGTGNHETTSLMMEVMLEMELQGKSLLDMGCGTGILAVLAAMRGAGPVTAIDIDEWSYSATLENSVLNNTPQVTALLGDAGLLGSERFDVILANIQKNVILADLAKYRSVIHSGGEILLSGFYVADMDDILREATRLELEFVSFREKNKWVVVRLKAS
jgi:ribosomal protein L11 methyltransferase